MPGLGCAVLFLVGGVLSVCLTPRPCMGCCPKAQNTPKRVPSEREYPCRGVPQAVSRSQASDYLGARALQRAPTTLHAAPLLLKPPCQLASHPLGTSTDTVPSSALFSVVQQCALPVCLLVSLEPPRAPKERTEVVCALPLLGGSMHILRTEKGPNLALSRWRAQDPLLLPCFCLPCFCLPCFWTHTCKGVA